jgi:AraC-like DNA-binding protein
MTRTIRKINSIAEFHKLRGLSGPNHPLISLVDYSKTLIYPENLGESWVVGMYSIAIKGNVGTVRYGQQTYDFDDGVMSFMSPGQVIQVVPNTLKDKRPWGWILLIHPDFLWNSPLSGKIKQYDFFGYSINEALFLSENEKMKILDIFQKIKEEYEGNMDGFSQQIMLSHIDLLLNYSERYYQRQFITRKITNHQVVDRLEQLLTEFFDDAKNIKGLPSVIDLAHELALSPNYLSSLLKQLTGRSTQQHIHDKLIEKAKEKLSTSELTVSQIAYDLGFEHPQSFSKMFKAKTNQTPVQFRQAFIS